ncbi:MAG: type I secretion system permease/ATPase [Hyphomicrobiaceae bacterium]
MSTDNERPAGPAGAGPDGRLVSASAIQAAMECPLDRAVRTMRRGLILVGAFSVVVNVLMLTTSVYLMQISDRVLVSRSLDTLTMLTIGAVMALVVLAAFDLLRKRILSRLGVRLEAMLGGEILAKSMERTLGGQSPEVQGLRDLGQLRSFLSGPIVPQLFDLPVAPFYIALVWMVHPDLGMIMLAGAVVLAGFALANQRLTHKAHEEASKAGLQALSRAQSQTRNADSVRAMGMLDDCIRLWGVENVRSIKLQIEAGDRNGIISACSKFFRLVLQIAILGWGAYLTLKGDITSGMAISASIIGARALAPVEGAIESWKTVIQTKECYGRLKKLLGAEGVRLKERTWLPEPRGEIVVEKLVYLSPQTRDPIIKQIGFRIPAGQSVAIIGQTGAGKSTLVKMLAGALSPSAGCVRLDGYDIANWDPTQFGRSIGFLPQDVELFPGTIAENISRLRADVSSEDVVKAAEAAEVHELISRLKSGYETVVYERGAPLSGGQRQRVALARAFFGAPKLLVLDEPDAALDRDGEASLVKALANAKKAGATVIVTTQRTALLNIVDRIIVMKDGLIDLYGPRDAVLERLAGAVPAKAGVAAPTRTGHEPLTATAASTEAAAKAEPSSAPAASVAPTPQVAGAATGGRKRTPKAAGKRQPGIARAANG